MSFDKSGRAWLVDEQDADLEGDARANDWTVTARYSDNDLSASRFASHGGRPDWGTLLEDIGAGRLDIVAFWTSSRGSRTLTEWSMFLDLVRARGGRSGSKSITGSTARGGRVTGSRWPTMACRTPTTAMS